MHTKTKLYSLFSILLLLSSGVTKAYDKQPIVIDSGILPLRINQQVFAFETEDKLSLQQAIESIRQGDLKPTKSKSSKGFSQNYFWIHFTLSNSDSNMINLVLDLDNPHIDQVLFYKQNTNSSIEKLGFGGDKTKFYERSEINRRYIFSFVLNSNETANYYLMVDKRNASVSFPLKIWKQNDF